MLSVLENSNLKQYAPKGNRVSIMNGFIKCDMQEIRTQLQSHALTICGRYLSNGVQHGTNWIVGSLDNKAGKSMSVDLTTGYFKDFATDEKGDLLEILTHYNNDDFKLALGEAISIIGYTFVPNDCTNKAIYSAPIQRIIKKKNRKKAYAIYAQGQSIKGTLAETYLRNRGIKFVNFLSLKFSPNLLVYDDKHMPHRLPCLIAGVSNSTTFYTGIQRIFLDAQGNKSQIIDTKRSLGTISGLGVWFGKRKNITTLVIAEGIETALSIQNLLRYTTVATLGSGHMIHFVVPEYIQHVIIAQDNDKAGMESAKKLQDRLILEGFQVRIISPILNDFNDDLNEFNKTKIMQHINPQLHS